MAKRHSKSRSASYELKNLRFSPLNAFPLKMQVRKWGIALGLLFMIIIIAGYKFIKN